jgi:threonine dehydrogenase-like Zn-dependent dehydrogenase
MKGRIAVLHEYGGDFEIQEFPVPEVEPGAILVRLTRAGVCGSDLHIWRGEMHEVYGKPLPPQGINFGHEMCGRVARLGPGVATDSMGQPLGEGDRITYAYFFPCGRCPVCLRGDLGNCPQKAQPKRVAGTPPYFNNAYGDYYYLRPDHFVFKVPDELPDDVVAPVNCALCQVLYGLHQAGLRFGDTLVIQGAGGLGLNATAVARDMGAERIIVIDQIAGRLALAREFGADHTLSLKELPAPEQRIAAVMDLTGGWGADVVADLVGYPQVIPEGLQMLRSGGCYLEVGNIAPGNFFSYDATKIMRRNVRIVGTSNYSPWALPRALDFLRRNRRRFPFDKVISHTFPLERIGEAFRQAEWLQRQGDPTQISRAAISMA